MATAQKKPAVVPTLRPSSRQDLERYRKGVVAVGPSGMAYRIRQVPLERHALAGGLPASLVKVALEGQEALQKVFEDMGRTDLTPEEQAHQQEVRQYLDSLVLAAVLEPELTPDDFGDPSKLDNDALVPPLDYQWLVNVAMRETDSDAEGRRLWGAAPLSRFQLFRDFHECPEDCARCEGLRIALAAPPGDNGR